MATAIPLSLDVPSEHRPILSPEDVAELDRRVEDIRAGRVKPYSHEEMRALFAERKRRQRDCKACGGTGEDAAGASCEPCGGTGSFCSTCGKPWDACCEAGACWSPEIAAMLAAHEPSA